MESSLIPMLLSFCSHAEIFNKIWYLSIFFFLNVAPMLFNLHTPKPWTHPLMRGGWGNVE